MGNNNCHNKNLDKKKDVKEHFEFPRRLPERNLFKEYIDIFNDPFDKTNEYDTYPSFNDNFSSEEQKYIELIICHDDNNIYERYDMNGQKINNCIYKKWKIKGLSPSYFNKMKGGQNNTKEEDITDEDLENSDENDVSGDTEELEVEEKDESISSSTNTSDNSSETNSCSSVDKNGNCKNNKNDKNIKNKNNQNKYLGKNPNYVKNTKKSETSSTENSSETTSCSSIDKNENCKNKKNKYSGNSSISGLKSDDSTDGITVKSDISSSDLYDLQSRIFTSMTQSDDDLTEDTEKYYNLINKIKENKGGKNLHTSETKEIFNMKSDNNSTTNEFIRRTKFKNSKYS